MSILSQALPIILLILTGVVLRLFSVVSEQTIEELKKLVVALILPSVLFTVFLDLDYQSRYLAFFVLLAVICVGMFFIGKLIGRRLAPNHPYFPFLFTGFEYGMLGVSLFGGAYGLHAVGYIAIVDLAHELFIWFVFAPLLMIRRDGNARPSAIVGMFITSPVIIGLVGGLVCNALGLGPVIKTTPVLSSVYQAMTMIASLVVPLILIIVGYGIRIRLKGLGDVLLVTVLRYAIFITAALTLNEFVVGRMLGLGEPFKAALFTLMILPPPFIIPLFMQKAGPDEKAYVTNALAVSTVFALVAFSVYLAAHPHL